jgi:hypothetical protein
MAAERCNSSRTNLGWRAVPHSMCRTLHSAGESMSGTRHRDQRTAAKVIEGMPLRAAVAMSPAVPVELSNLKVAVNFLYPVCLAAEMSQVPSVND